ncbi:uncharacterized protein LOC121878935 isoform X3 [Homarus americanus]|uniref:uncharacterized protein LOC121878935 isoform X3 n=1 Tax=Homarus americanus TaxID=6706 RepID=UPI001C45F387|nr:uncharacterized protein LOC121878935 isoform X3 [Homarus americanus]
MGRNKLTVHEKAWALTQLELGMSVIRVAADLKVSRQSIYHLRHAAAPLPPGAIPKRKVGSGAVRKTSQRTDNILKREVMSDPAVTASTLKKRYPNLLKHVAIRTVQHRLQKDLGLPTRRAAKKPLLAEAMKKKRLNFSKKYQYRTSDDWKKNNSIKGNVNELHEKLEKEENSEGEEIKPDIKYEEFDPETVYVEDDTGLVSLLDLDSLQQQQQQQSPQQHSPPNDHLTNDNGGGEGIIKQCPDLTEPVPTTSSSVPYSRGDQVNEFHLFGMNVASQLRAMPLRAALEVQLQIQRILTQKRLEIQ